MTLDSTIKLYNTVGHRNADFLFNWIRSVYDFFYLPSVDTKHKSTLIRDKTKMTIFDVLIDDLADNAEIRNIDNLEQAIKIPWETSKTYDNKYLEATRKIWEDCIESIKKYPRYEEFKDLFYFDLDKTLHSMKYSYLVNQIGMNNLLEDEMYIKHGCMVILHADMDLMCSPTFDKKELKKLRPILHWIEDIVHIGNLMNTYAKEVEEADFSSPMLSLALDKGLFDRQTVLKNPEFAISKLENLVPYFKEKIEDDFQKIEYYADSIKSIDITEVVNRLRKVIDGFLNREQYWKTTMVKNSEVKTSKNDDLTQDVLPPISHWVRI
jgi:hypothetical protein